MSGTLKSGLLFGLVGLFAVLIVSFVPVIGAILCGPGTALIIGGVAGYFAVRWTLGNAGVGQGVLAGSISGVGLLIGSILFFIIAFSMVQGTAEFDKVINDAIAQQNPSGEVDPEAIRSMMGLVGPMAGLCFGVLNLVLALAGGAIGGAIGGRRPTADVVPPIPPAIPPMS